MKIAFYISTISHGGAERVIVNLAKEFAINGHDVTLITDAESNNEYEIDSNISRINLGYNRKNRIIKNIYQIHMLRRTIKENRSEVLITFLPEPIIRALIATICINVKNIISIRNDPKIEYKNVLHKQLANFLYQRADRVVFQTKEAQNFFSARIQKKSTIIMNQVNKDFYEYERCGTGEYFIAVGRLTPQKNYYMMIEAFKRFCQNNPNSILRIYGDGPMKNELQDLIKRQNLDRNILLMGITQRVPDALAKAKAYVLTSNYEGMPNALLEAMAMGLPCIATDCPSGGPKAIITHKENGFLVPINDVDSLVEYLNIVENNKLLNEEISINAKNKAEEFRPLIVYKKWEDVIINK